MVVSSHHLALAIQDGQRLTVSGMKVDAHLVQTRSHPSLERIAEALQGLGLVRRDEDGRHRLEGAHPIPQHRLFVVGQSIDLVVDQHLRALVQTQLLEHFGHHFDLLVPVRV